MGRLHEASHVLVRPKRLLRYCSDIDFTMFPRIMARPQKENKEKRSIKFTFRMNEDEFKQLAKLCEYANLSGAEVVREIVFKNRLLQPKVPVLDVKTYTELKRIGNNINQIAKHLNSGMTKLIDFEIIDELSIKLDNIIKAILK